MTILESAKAGLITPEMELCAQDEQVSPEFIRSGVADGTIVVLKSSRPNIRPVAVGKGMTTKVSASVGMYEEYDTPEGELAKIDEALSAGTDTIMDLSVRGDIRGLREQVLSRSKIPVGDRKSVV